MQLVEGSVVGDRYRADRLLGRGGMGEVWLCHDLDREVDVAVKAVLPDALRGEEAARLFHGEVVAAARLSHPGIVAVYDLLRPAPDETYLVMAYRPGRPLSAFLPHVDDFGFVCEVLVQVLRALAYAHARGVLHLDIKPDNLIVEAKGAAVRTTLVDFGIARVRTPGEGIERWLKRDTVMGTLAYMAPEQCAGRLDRFGPWTDLYAVGAMAYELCVGRAPFDDHGAAMQTIFRRLSEEAPPLVPAIEGVPQELVELCATLLAIQPSERPTHVADVLFQIERMRPRGRLRVPRPDEPRRVDSSVQTGDAPAAHGEAPTAGASAAPTREASSEPAADPLAATGLVRQVSTDAETAPRDPISGDATVPRTAAFDGAPDAARVARAATLAVPADTGRRQMALARGEVRLPRASAPLPRDSIVEQLRSAELDTEVEPEPGAYGLFGLRELPVIGREAERRAVWEALGEVVLGGRPRLILLEGPAGAGKSRLARDALERSHELGLCLTMQTRWSAEGSGDEGVRGLIENLLDSRGADLTGVRRRLEFWLERSEGDHGPFRREVELLLRPPPGAAPDAGMPVRVAVEAIEKASARRPVMLWLDDVQWSRGQTAALLEAIAKREPPLPVCVVATAREEEIEDRADHDALLERLGEGAAAHVAMGHLDATATRRLVRGLLDVDDELAVFLSERAEGNPLFVTQLLAELVRAEAVEYRDGRYRVSGGFDLEAVPRDIGALWDRRLARSRADRRLLAALALARDEVSVDVARALGEELAEDLEPEIEIALEQGLLRLHGGSYAWVHGLLRDHLVRSLAPVDRRRFAAAAAVALAPLVGTEDVQEERARHLFEAGDPEAACRAMIDAIAWSERRAELAPRRRRAEALCALAAGLDAMRARGLAELGVALVMQGEGEEADARIADALEIAEAHGLEDPWVFLRQAQVANRQRRVDEAETAAQLALASAARSPDLLASAFAQMHVAVDALRQGDRSGAEAHFRSAISAAREARDPHYESRLLARLGDLQGERGLPLLDQAVHMAERSGALLAELEARFMRADALFQAGRGGEAREEAKLVAREAQRRGLRQLVALNELVAAHWEVVEEDWGQARLHRSRAVDAGAASGARAERVALLALDLVLALVEGRHDDAADLLERLDVERGSYWDPVLVALLSRARALAPAELSSAIPDLEA